MSKSDIITVIAGLVADDPRLATIAAALNGTAQPDNEPWLSLTKVSAAVDKHIVWLSKLDVPKACGVRLGGRLSYKRTSVEAYLQSPECAARLEWLRQERKRKTLAKDATLPAAA